jgi:hypothetical protein
MGKRLTNQGELRMTFLEPSKATKNDGAFVRGLQGATGTGMASGTHVHKDWYAKTLSFDTVCDRAEKAAQDRTDYMVERSEIQPMVADGEFKIGVRGKTFRPTDHCLQQLSARAGVKSASILREMRADKQCDALDAETMVDIANNSLRRVKADKVFRLRTYNDGTARAMLTDKYAPVDNRWYLEVLRKFLPDGRFSHDRSDEDTVYGNILLPDTILDKSADDDTDYGGMVSIGNCEIGKRRLSQYPSIFRAICMNGCIWGQQKGQKISKVHRGVINLDSLETAISENITMQLKLLPEGLDRFLATRSQKIKGSAKGVIAAVAADFRLSKVEATRTMEAFAKHESHQQNLFGVINAVTRAGQLGSNDNWVRLDEIGGQLMDITPNRWSRLNTIGSTMTDKDFERAFALTA